MRRLSWETGAIHRRALRRVRHKWASAEYHQVLFLRPGFVLIWKCRRRHRFQMKVALWKGDDNVVLLQGIVDSKDHLTADPQPFLEIGGPEKQPFNQVAQILVLKLGHRRKLGCTVYY